MLFMDKYLCYFTPFELSSLKKTHLFVEKGNVYPLPLHLLYMQLIIVKCKSYSLDEHIYYLGLSKKTSFRKKL